MNLKSFMQSLNKFLRTFRMFYCYCILTFKFVSSTLVSLQNVYPFYYVNSGTNYTHYCIFFFMTNLSLIFVELRNSLEVYFGSSSKEIMKQNYNLLIIFSTIQHSKTKIISTAQFLNNLLQLWQLFGCTYFFVCFSLLS